MPARDDTQSRSRVLPTVDPDGTGFLSGYDHIFPGAAAATVPMLNGQLFARAHWPSESNALATYTCNQPGYFTTMEGWLGEPVGISRSRASTRTASIISRDSSKARRSPVSAPRPPVHFTVLGASAIPEP